MSKHVGGGQSWSVNGHGYIERLATDVDLALDGDRSWLVSWKASGRNSETASDAWGQE